MVRIKDIAKAAGVSVGTVDRVLHNRGKVAKEVEKKVQETIDTLGYRPNLAARSLAKQSAHNIAIILPEDDQDEYWLSQASGIQRALFEFRNFGLTGDILRFNDLEKNDLSRLAETIFEGNYEGVLIAPTVKAEAEELMNLCDLHEMPYVQINSYIKRSKQFALGYVGQDSYKAGSLGAKLLDFGTVEASTLALLHMEHDIENSTHLLSKEAGFKKYWADRNQEGRVLFQRMVDVEQSDKLKNQIVQLLDKYPNLKGFFITTSRVHLIVDILIELGREDIALVGFDLVQKNIETLKKYQRLFLINQNPSLQGYYGVMRLFDHFLKNKSVNDSKYLPLGVVTQENVDNYVYMKDRDNI